MLAHLEGALSGHPGADAALALAEKLLGRVATGESEPARRRLDLLRAAHGAEYEPARRARLGWRLAAQLEAVGDAIGAVAVLERALSESAPGEGARVRGERARLLRSLWRPRELAAALEKDAGALLGDARLPVLAEQAALLEAAGEAERALDVRLMALAEFPGAPAVLDEARAAWRRPGGRRVAVARGRGPGSHDRSRAPPAAAARRRAAQRAAGGQRQPGDAASAWLAVLGIDPADATRRPRRSGCWSRSATGSAAPICWRGRWRAPARRREPPTPRTPSAALLWRLAELRRERLGQTDEALRLYGQLGRRARRWRRSPIRPSWRRSCGAI